MGLSSMMKYCKLCSWDNPFGNFPVSLLLLKARKTKEWSFSMLSGILPELNPRACYSSNQGLQGFSDFPAGKELGQTACCSSNQGVEERSRENDSCSGVSEAVNEEHRFKPGDTRPIIGTESSALNSNPRRRRTGIRVGDSPVVIRGHVVHNLEQKLQLLGIHVGFWRWEVLFLQLFSYIMFIGGDTRTRKRK
nr:hypothetical protein Iba_scaffold14336CG0060 [Ipomoea batatas]